MKCFEKWSYVFISVFAKNNIRCVVLNFLQPVHLIAVDVNEQRGAVVQPIENKRTHQMSSDFCCQEMVTNVLLISRYAERLTWSVCFTTDRVDPEIFNMVFERNMTASSHVVSCDTLTFLRDPTKRASFLPLFSFGLLPVIHLPKESTH